MKSSNQFLIAFFLVIMLSSSSAQAAEEQEFVQKADSYNSLNSLKRGLGELLAENSKLESEYEDLKSRFEALQQVYKSHAAEIAEIKQPFPIPMHQEPGIDNQAEKQLDDSETELLMAQSQIAYVQSQLLDTDERLHLLRLKLSELQYTKRDIEMEQKLANFSKKENEVDKEQTLDELKRNYEQSLEQEKKMLQEIDDLKKNSSNAGSETQQLKLSNQQLQMQIGQLETQRKFKEQENDLLRNKKLYQTRLSESEIYQMEQKKLELDKKLAMRETEFNQLDAQLKNSAESQVKHRELLDSIMAVDQDNQQLKSKINQLQEKIKTLQ